MYIYRCGFKAWEFSCIFPVMHGDLSTIFTILHLRLILLFIRAMLPSAVERCRRDYRSKSVSSAQLLWATFRVRHTDPTLVDVRRHPFFPFPILFYISPFANSPLANLFTETAVRCKCAGQ